MVTVRCPRCDRAGNTYDIIVDQEKRTYKVFATCPSCMESITVTIQWSGKPPGDYDVVGSINRRVDL